MAPPVGYWETLGFSPSSVDFCEPNFERSAWVAEPWNAASSLPYVALGLFGVCVANPMRRAPAAHGWERPAFALAYLLTAVIGAGSVALHATMIAPGQAADEAPMLLLNAVLVFILCELGSGAAALRRPWLPKAFAAASGAAVAVYARWRAFYEAFMTLYLLSIFCIVAGCARLAFGRAVGERTRRGLVKPLFFAAIGSYAVGGGTAWVVEFHFCALVRESVLGPAFLHPLWHVGALGGTWLCVQLLSAARVDACGEAPELRWRCGLPVAAYPAKAPRHAG